MAAVFGVKPYAIQKALKHLGITRKKTTLCLESKAICQQAFLKQLNELPPETIIYLDECGIEQYVYREYAYKPRGQKVVAKISGKKFKRTNIVAGICCGKWVAPFEYTGTTDSILFEYWFEHGLLKEAPVGSMFVLDTRDIRIVRFHTRQGR